VLDGDQYPFGLDLARNPNEALVGKVAPHHDGYRTVPHSVGRRVLQQCKTIIKGTWRLR
jgi:hypothetical protein